MDKRATWTQAIITLLAPLVLVFAIRWAFFEPYVIPSGSMIPSLLIHDHILVNKFRFGLRWPFSDRFFIRWGEPQAGEILVFRYPQNPEIFYVKRVVAGPGQEIEVRDGVLIRDGVPVAQEPVDAVELGIESEGETGNPRVFREEGHLVQYFSQYQTPIEPRKLGPGEWFVMGDNRDRSSDSRVWGTVKAEHLIGKPILIWLSCDKTLETAPMICHPGTIRWSRLFQLL